MTKTNLSELAIFGAAPAFSEQLHVGRPNIGDRADFLAHVNDILDRRWLTNSGPKVLALEQQLTERLQVKHAIAMCNATVALEIAIRAAGVTGEAIVPSYTFIATAHALQWQGITPVFCDIDPRTHCLDPHQVERHITPRTTAIIGVHIWGTPCAVDELTEIAQRRNLHLIFDAAHAFGSTYHGRPVGGFGDAEVFSFHATKFFNTFEGGAVTTNDDALAERVRFMRNFGFAGYDQVDYIGTNGKMSEVSAAMGLTNLRSMPEFIAASQRNYQSYAHHLADIPGISLFAYPIDSAEQRNFQYIVLEIDEAKAGLSRDQLQKVLWQENVLARRYFYPGCHNMQPYKAYFPHAGLLLPETEALNQRVMVLPSGTTVDDATIAKVCGLLRMAVQHAAAVRAQLQTMVATA